MTPLHPIVVHFPIVLLISAGVLYLIGILRRRDSLTRIGFAFHVAGLLFSIAGILTGDYAESQTVQTTVMHELIETHEMLAMVATWGFGLLGVWAYLRQKSTVIAERLAYLLVFWGLIGALSYGAHLGGRIVFEHGGGVAPMEKHIRP